MKNLMKERAPNHFGQQAKSDSRMKSYHRTDEKQLKLKFFALDVFSFFSYNRRMKKRPSLMLALAATTLLHGCAVIAVADAAITVGATAVSITATTVSAGASVVGAGVEMAAGAITKDKEH